MMSLASMSLNGLCNTQREIIYQIDQGTFGPTLRIMSELPDGEYSWERDLQHDLRVANVTAGQADALAQAFIGSKNTLVQTGLMISYRHYGTR